MKNFKNFSFIRNNLKSAYQKKYDYESFLLTLGDLLYLQEKVIVYQHCVFRLLDLDLTSL